MEYTPHKGGSRFVPEPGCPDCIRAVNNHDALLSALEELADEQALFTPQLPPIYMKRLEQARAAILAAKGEAND